MSDTLKITITLSITSILLSLIGICITKYYLKHSKKISDDQMLKQLFTEFNQRYNELNDYLLEIELDKINLLDDNDKSKAFRKKAIDYFNLCAEEYFWHKHKERIDPVIWKSWQEGIRYWFDVPAIKSLWKEEIKNNGYLSYYLNDEDEFFNI
ncbi:MAG: hypothetical protein GQ534_04135 [Candidatus Delongbacteria bacterium]|nr:hypothetical protein [Candidatus Delongbacteria bacterium]